MANNYKWPLNVSQFSAWDRLKLAHFVLTNDRWTHGEVVQDFERQMAAYVGCKYALFTSSGSTANTLLAMWLQDYSEVGRDTIVFPSTTWVTSVSPFIREGFAAEFIDINLENFSIDTNKLEDYLEKEASRVACIFVTSLIGFTPNMRRLQALSRKYNVRIMMDNCENTLGRFDGKNISSFFTSTTSTYFGHQLQSIEGGFVFTDHDTEYEYFTMARNHGMLRHLEPEAAKIYRNPNVDERFDFRMLGNNFRNTNINALLGSFELARAEKYRVQRRKVYDLFRWYMSGHLILPMDNESASHAPFCFPIIVKPHFSDAIIPLREMCDKNGIETRPIISGNLLRQTCIKRSDYLLFENSEYLHKYGFYIGLHGSTSIRDVEEWATKALNILLKH
jgi:CDP-6-deoxy-D-xylo-4-hexulose-3-dehydrase